MTEELDLADFSLEQVSIDYGIEFRLQSSNRRIAIHFSSAKLGDGQLVDVSRPSSIEALLNLLHVHATKVERTDGGVDAELMRPREWIERYGIEAGQLPPLNLEELQVQGLAHVNSVNAAPCIASGEGSAVNGRFITRQMAHRLKLQYSKLTITLPEFVVRAIEFY